MPVQYEPFNTSTDVTTTKTLLHEVIPITGSIVSGTYGVANIKNYSHGMFQSVYDYPYLSSSANHIFDITAGYDETSALSGASIQNTKKINIYNQYAQVLLGYAGTGSAVRRFESDDTLDDSNPMKEVFFINFSRLIMKDQIKKGSFALSLGTSSAYSTPFADDRLVLQDALTRWRIWSSLQQFIWYWRCARQCVLSSRYCRNHSFSVPISCSDEFWWRRHKRCVDRLCNYWCL